MNATLAEYAARGWSLKPVLAGQKRPIIKGWPDREFGPADCGDGMNIAIRLGTHSRDLVDCDLDCEEAIELAPLYLPETGAIFGRSSAPRSHWLYFAPEAQFEAFVDPIAQETLLELRADGRDGGAHITIVPPSVANGERREWCSDAIEPTVVGSMPLRPQHGPARGRLRDDALRVGDRRTQPRTQPAQHPLGVRPHEAAP